MKFLRYVRHSLTISAVLFLSSCATTFPVYEVQRDELNQWYSNARALVENERGINLSNVTLSAVSDREMLFVLSDLYGKKLDPNMTADTRVRVFADKAFEDVKYVQAVYDPFAKRIVLNQQNLKYYIGQLEHQGIDPQNAAMTILIHELIHAADDKEYDLLAIEKRHTGDTLGLSMVAEGHAELQTESICATSGCSAAFKAAQIAFHGADPHDTDQTLLTSQNNNGLVYVQGRMFLKALADRDNSGELVKQALISPPGGVLEFFDPADFPNKGRSIKRERIYQTLNSVEIQSMQVPLLKIPQAIFNESVLPADSKDRMRYVREYKQKTLASGSMNYVEQNNQDLKSVHVKLFEASSPETALSIQQDAIDDHRTFVRRMKKMGADIHHPGSAELEALSEGVPANTQRYVIDFDNHDTGDTLRLFASYLVIGRHVIIVSNANDNSLNRETLLEVTKRLASR